MKIIVSNLSSGTGIQDINNLFSPYGQVLSVHMDKALGSDDIQANIELSTGGNKAINELNGFILNGNPISVADAETDDIFKTESQQQNFDKDTQE